MESQPRNRILLVTLLAVVLSAAITGGIVYTVQSKQNNDTKTDLQAQVDSLKAQLAALPTVTPTPVATATPIPTATPAATATPVASPSPSLTADWKTYTSNDMGVSFKYPPTWKVSTASTGTGGKQTAITVSSDDQTFFELSTTLADYDNQTIASQYATLVSINKVNKGYSAIPDKKEVRALVETPGASDDNVFFATGKKVIVFSTDTSATGYSKNKNNYDLMVSSFSSF